MSLAHRQSAVAVGALFVCNGVLVGTFGGSLPAFRKLLDLTDADVVGVLVTAGVFAVVSMQVSGRVADRIGARVPSFVGGLVMLSSTWVLGTARGYVWLLVGAAVFGVGNGIMDVAMNAAGVVVEQARGGPIMSRFHAFFSIGNFVGAGIVATLGGWQLRAPVLVGGVVALVLLASVWRTAPQTPRVVHDGPEGRPGKVPTFAWLLAVMALCFGLTEGTAVDWSSIHTTDVGGVTPSQGAWGLACVSGFMVLIRLLGDHAVHRFGSRAVVAGGSACALLGYLVTALATALPLILVGWCIVGLGVGLIAPQIYGLAGRAGGGRVLAIVVSFGYTAFLIGPAVIGFIATHTGTAEREGIQNAMFLPVVTALALVVMASRLPGQKT
ncbi:MAG TPA: MFS transporter [Marmoricola sp.]|nr:MFS transporter [Marmoricola sp.]